MTAGERLIRQGREQGIQQGIYQGRLDVAKAMLKTNMPIETVAQLSGLSKAQLSLLVREFQ